MYAKEIIISMDEQHWFVPVEFKWGFDVGSLQGGEMSKDIGFPIIAQHTSSQVTRVINMIKNIEAMKDQVTLSAI